MRKKNQNIFLLGAGIALFFTAIYSSFYSKHEVHDPEQLEVSTLPRPPIAVESPVTLLAPPDGKSGLIAPVVAPLTASPPPDNPPNSQQQAFQTFVDSTYLNLVQSKDLMASAKRSLHDTPPETFRDSEAFGKIMDEVKANGQLVPVAMDFYERCALNPSVIAPTRSVCLSHLKYWSEKKQIPFNANRFPSEILATAEKLPVLWE